MSNNTHYFKIVRAMGLGVLARISRIFTKFDAMFIASHVISHLLHARLTKDVDVASVEENIKIFRSLNKIKDGEVIPWLFGRAKVHGKVLWCGELETRCNTYIAKRKRGGYIGKIFNLQKKEKKQEYQYSISLALAICKGKVDRINKVYCNDQILNISKYKYALYHGDAFQNPDPTIQKHQGANKTPGFRGLCYIVFTSLPLEDFNNQIPKLTFEVSMTCDSQNSLENKITALNMIPGSGEFVYDVVEQKKWFNGQYYTINAHNKECKPNAIISLEQLSQVCKKVKYIAPVVCWFGDSLDIKYCNILPKIESQDTQHTIYPHWCVGRVHRNAATLVSRDAQDRPNYGGTVDDASIVRYLKHLKDKGYKIMFYPMIFLDINGKPWRGHLSGESADVEQFFNKKNGYNNFILHYANLTKGYIDAFLIGSELKKLTTIRDSNANYPAVKELISLAAKVRNILGNSTLISYAADWSEYHHDEHGYHHLDELFADNNIDFVGIDAYFPITDSQVSDISKQEILDGMSSLEGYEYYYHNDQKHYLKPQYAWKNLRYWWENYHYNPNGSKTKWEPKMKKIWFTEFGFPSIDKAPNQPNVFYNPECVDGNIPRYSNGSVDFGIQRNSIETFIDYWSEEEYIGQMFLWAWDARPYPLWPHTDIWSDNHLWEKGHWVNGKLGVNTLSEVLQALSARVGIHYTHINTQQLEQEIVDGLAITQQMSVADVISLLRTRYFFDPIFKGRIMFSKRGVSEEVMIDQRDLITQDGWTLKIDKIAQSKIISTLHLYFVDKEYKGQYLVLHSQHDGTNARLNISSLLTSILEARDVGEMILSNALLESGTVFFALPIHYMNLSVGDFIKLLSFTPSHLSEHAELTEIYRIRVIQIEIHAFQYKILGVLDNFKAYYIPRGFCAQRFMIEEQIQDKLLLLDLPFTYQAKSGLACFVQGNADTLYACYLGREERLQSVEQRGIIGSVLEVQDSCLNYRFIDNRSYFKVYAPFLEDFIELDGWKLAQVGDEIIQFLTYEKYAKDCYKISSLCRGLYATQDFIGNHRLTEDFVLLDLGQVIMLQEEAIGSKISIKTNTGAMQCCVFENRAKGVLKPILKHTFQKDAVDDGGDEQYGTLLEWIVRLAPENEDVSLKQEVILCIENEDGIVQYETQIEGSSCFVPHAQDAMLSCSIIVISNERRNKFDYTFGDLKS